MYEKQVAVGCFRRLISVTRFTRALPSSLTVQPGTAAPPMATPDILRRFGLFVVENFLDARECRDLCEEMRRGGAGKATVFKKVDYVYDENVRRTRTAHVGEGERLFVASRPRAVLPDAARHFGLRLSDTEEPQFLIYRPGDFFRLHRDRGPDETAPAHTRRRAVSLVLMLNGPSEEPRGALRRRLARALGPRREKRLPAARGRRLPGPRRGRPAGRLRRRPLPRSHARHARREIHGRQLV